MPWAASIRMNADRGLGSRFLRCVAPQPLVFRHLWYCRFAGSRSGYYASFSRAACHEQQLKEAQLHREIARLEVRHYEEIVRQRTLQSPIDGIVLERLLVPGEYQNEQSPILRLAQIDQLRVEVFVPTSRYGEIRVGSAAEVDRPSEAPMRRPLPRSIACSMLRAVPSASAWPSPTPGFCCPPGYDAKSCLRNCDRSLADLGAQRHAIEIGLHGF